MLKEEKESSLVKAHESAAIALTPENVLAYVNPRATKQEIALFLNQCVMFGLNPFKREIYLIKYSDKDPATFVVGYESYLKRAERTQKWSGMESGTVDEAGRPVKAWAKIYRKDWTNPLYHEVFFEEYVQTRKNSQTGKDEPTRFWATKPRTMLKKVAICQAMRMAFPDEFVGMPYAAEEMPVKHEELSTAPVTVAEKYPDTKPAEVHAPKPGAPDEFSRKGDLTDPRVNPFSGQMPDGWSGKDQERYEASLQRPQTEVEKALEADLDAPEEESGADPLTEAHHDTPEKHAEKMADEPKTIKLVLSDGKPRMLTKAEALKKFSKVKEVLGEDDYNEILKLGKYDDATQIPDHSLPLMYGLLLGKVESHRQYAGVEEGDHGD